MLHFEGALFTSGKFLCKRPWNAFAMSQNILHVYYVAIIKYSTLKPDDIFENFELGSKVSPRACL